MIISYPDRPAPALSLDGVGKQFGNRWNPRDLDLDVSPVNGVRLRSRRHRRQLLELVDLHPERRTTVDRSSGGMKRRPALAAALVHEPAFIMLDEPTAGIDPVQGAADPGPPDREHGPT